MSPLPSPTSDAAARCPYPSLESVPCPYPIFDELREIGVKPPGPDNDAYIISRHEDISYVLRHPEVFSSTTDLNAEAQPGWEASVFSSDPPEHTVKREIAHRVLLPARLRTYEPMIQGIVDELIDDFIDDGRVEFVSQFAKHMSSYVMFNLLDIPREESRWIADITFEGIGARFLPEAMREQQAIDGVRVNDYMTKVVTERIDNLGDDAISHLILGHRERKSEDDIPYLAVEASVFLLGGVLTSAHLTSSAMKLLLDHPDQMRAVREDHSLIPNMLEEAMRVESPLQFMPRVALADTEVAGIAIPRGAELLLIYAAGSRDDDVFSDAARFDIHRRNTRRHLGFGLGPHFCLGAPLARMEGLISYRTLFERLDDIAYEEGHEEISYIPSAFNRGPQELHLTFTAAG